MLKDALNNEIILGNTYGLAVSSNGISIITVGTAEKLTEKGNVTLRIIHSRYAHSSDYFDNTTKKTISPRSYHLFPVSREEKI